MKNDLASQLFHGLAALSLKQAATLRPLTTREKSTLEQSEAAAGEMLPTMEREVQKIKEAGGL